jgi:hypothetical protein
MSALALPDTDIAAGIQAAAEEAKATGGDRGSGDLLTASVTAEIIQKIMGETQGSHLRAIQDVLRSEFEGGVIPEDKARDMLIKGVRLFNTASALQVKVEKLKQEGLRLFSTALAGTDLGKLWLLISGLFGNQSLEDDLESEAPIPPEEGLESSEEEEDEEVAPELKLPLDPTPEEKDVPSTSAGLKRAASVSSVTSSGKRRKETREPLAVSKLVLNSVLRN